MSWWDIFGVTLGDIPVDQMNEGLYQVIHANEGRLPLTDLLTVFNKALQIFAADPGMSLVIETDSNQNISASNQNLAADDARIIILIKTFNDMDLIYREQLGRNVIAQELAESFMFNLRGSITDYCTDAASLGSPTVGTLRTGKSQ